MRGLLGSCEGGDAVGGKSTGTGTWGFSSGALAKSLARNSCPWSRECWASLHPLGGIKLGGSEGEREANKTVKAFGLLGGAPESTASGWHCPECPAGQAEERPQAASKLLDVGRMAGRHCGDRGGGLGHVG